MGLIYFLNNFDTVSAYCNIDFLFEHVRLKKKQPRPLTVNEYKILFQ